MAVQSIGAAASSSAAALQQTGLTQQDFLKVLLTQLQFQDPLKPMDNEQFMAQMAQFSALALQQQQNDKTDSLLTLQSASQTIGLIGKSVQVNTATGSQVGTVSSISFQSDGSPLMSVSLANGTVLTGIGPSQVSVVQ
jgi:flagellar basal-body rod modification protein FlgD